MELSRFGKSFMLAALGVLVAGCIGFYRPSFGPVGEKHRPSLLAVWAQPEIGDGHLWRIYVRATDPDNDLDKVWITFSQLGANYPGFFIILPPGHQAGTNGYVLIWAYLKGGGATGTVYGSAEVHIEDRAGNMSDSRTIEFAVVQVEKKDEGNPPSGFQADTLLGQLQGELEFPLQTDATIAGDGRGE